ncbi:MAG: AAA family ATPase [Chloroflexota bacterium]
MSTARLRSLRLVGFKSFAERTVVEFGAGISAIVGPNGSGKSNLADALRWVLGEQGRTLRTRRAEDLIYAGSSSRRAQGMSDVTLVLDNEDGLLGFGEEGGGRARSSPVPERRERSSCSTASGCGRPGRPA